MRLELFRDGERASPGTFVDEVIPFSEDGVATLTAEHLFNRRRLGYRIRHRIDGLPQTTAREAIFASHRLQPGFPVRQPWQFFERNGVPAAMYSRGAHAVGELISSQPGKEIALVTDGPAPTLTVLSSRGVVQWTRPIGGPALASDPIYKLSNVIITPLTPGESPSIIVHRAKRDTLAGPAISAVYAFRADGSTRQGFPAFVPAPFGGGEGTIAVADLDRDGSREIVLLVSFPQLALSERLNPHTISIITASGRVSQNRSLERAPQFTEWEDMYLNRFPRAAIGQLDGSSNLEIAVVTTVADSNGGREVQIAILNSSLDLVAPLSYRPGVTFNSPLIVDLDKSGQAEIFFDRVYLNEAGAYDSVIDVASLGSTLPAGWPKLLRDSPTSGGNSTFPLLLSSLSVADLDGDSRHEVIATNTSYGESGLWILNSNGQTIARNMNAIANSVVAPPAFADVDRDGRKEILLYANDSDAVDTAALRNEQYVMADNPDQPTFGLAAFGMNGAAVTSFHELVEGSLMGEGLTVTDIDEDGQAELIFVSNADRVPGGLNILNSYKNDYGYKNRGSLYVYTLGVPLASSALEATHRIDQGATGCVDCAPQMALPLPTVTPTNTPTATPTQTATSTATMTPTATRTNTPMATTTSTPTRTPTSTPTATLTSSPTLTATPTRTATSTPMMTPTATQTAIATPTMEPTAAALATPTSTPAVIPTTLTGPVLRVVGGQRRALRLSLSALPRGETRCSYTLELLSRGRSLVSMPISSGAAEVSAAQKLPKKAAFALTARLTQMCVGSQAARIETEVRIRGVNRASPSRVRAIASGLIQKFDRVLYGTPAVSFNKSLRQLSIRDTSLARPGCRFSILRALDSRMVSRRKIYEVRVAARADMSELKGDLLQIPIAEKASGAGFYRVDRKCGGATQRSTVKRIRD